MVFVSRQTSKVFNVVVRPVPVYMVDVATIRNGTEVIFPHSSVQPFPAVLEIESAQIEPFTVEFLHCVANHFNFHVETSIKSSPGFSSSSRLHVPSDNIKR